MRYTMLFYLFAILLLACCGSSADPHSMAQTGEVSDKAYYNIFPALDTDHGVTGSFVMDLMKTDDLMPWTDVQNNLISWTVEADNTQVAQLINHPGIKQVTKVDIPAPPEKHTPDDTVRSWLIVPKDPTNTAKLQETFEFLQSLADEMPEQVRNFRNEFWFFEAKMSKDRVDQVKQHPGVDWVEPNSRLRELSVASPPVGLSPTKARRDVEYATQKDAVTELVSVSQPSTIPDIGNLKNYVYEKHGGSKSFIYHVERGVAFLTYKSEFPNLAPTHILTPKAENEGFVPGYEPRGHFHSTCTADKALGQQFGVAKNAILVSVIMRDYDVYEVLAAFDLIAKDLQTHPERRKFSVVTMSLSMENDDPGNAWRPLWHAAIKRVMDLDVPVVVGAGNDAHLPGHQNIDTFPALFAGPDYPLIVVGSSNAAGDRSYFSQTGPQETVLAVGEDTTCFGGGASQPLTGKHGTSFSTGIVAGQIANLLSYDTVPVDTNDGKLVNSMRNYLAINPAAGWNRKPDTRVLWNGVEEDHNPVVPLDSNAFAKTCAGLASNKYVSRETLRSVIVDDFCPAVAD